MPLGLPSWRCGGPGGRLWGCPRGARRAIGAQTRHPPCPLARPPLLALGGSVLGSSGICVSTGALTWVFLLELL